MSTTQLPGQPTETESKLDEFIFHVDAYHSESVPRNLPPAETAAFITARVGPAAELRPLLQTEKVADYYDLQQIADHLRGLVGRLEGDASRLRQAAIAARTLAIVGSPPDLAFAAASYQRLAPKAAGLEDFQELLSLYDALNGTAGAEPLRARAGSVIASLQKQEKRAYDAELELQRLDEWHRITLPRAEKAQQEKSLILQIANRHQRIAEEIKAYLTLQYGYIEFLQPWAARRLRRETWGAQPSSQTTPARDPLLGQDVVRAFEEALATQQTPSLRVRCLRGILFFGGTLTDEQEQYLQVNAGQQLDRLSR